MQEIYFDNSATTRACKSAADAAYETMRQEFGNPSAVHHRGAEAFHRLNEARELVSQALSASPDEVYFTSGGTESNNTAIFGAYRLAGKNCRRVLVSAVEHPSVLNPARELLRYGADVATLPVDEQGVVILDALAELLNEQTALVSVMQVNNETGTIQPLAEIGALIRAHAPQAVFHVDGVQAFGRVCVDLAGWQADAYSASGHKLHAPKGIGLLWVKKSCRLPALLHGGGQEKGLRSGTENMPGIMAFAAAIREAIDGRVQYDIQMRDVKQTLLDAVCAQLDDVYVNGQPLEAAAPHIVNLSFVGARSEVLLHYLEQSGIYVSAGSACDSRSSKGSHVLTAMGLDNDRVDSALRFSFCRYNTHEEAEQVSVVLAQTVAEVRRLMSSKRKRR